MSLTGRSLFKLKLNFRASLLSIHNIFPLIKLLTLGSSGQISGEDDHAEPVKEEDEPPKQQALKGHEDIISDFNINDGSLSQDTGQPPVTLHIVKVETANEVQVIEGCNLCLC